MEARLNDLKSLLEEEIETHEALRKELEQEAAQDGAMDGMTLLKTQQDKIRLVREIQALERRRMQIVDELAGIWNEAPADLTLRRIISRVEEALGQRLGESHARLVALVEDIRRLAKETSFNAQARLKAIDATLAVINETIKMHPTYSEEGRLQKVTPSFRQTSV
ncbi:MAG: flagellar export chaperone FlgN [SAR324 cluster bacterium]|nr:flagellar export chaperone FlgN [SAR324 cluster bacterium]